MKANSDRVSGKNFRDLAGKPLFRWILDTLLAVKEIDAVVINTDARQILEDCGLTESERIIIRDRRHSLLGDFTSMNLILEDDIKEIDSDSYLMTHTTNPLLGANTIRAAIKQYYENDDADSLFSVNRLQTRFYREDGTAVNHDPNNLVRTQDLEPWYEENSCLYLFNKNSFSKTHARIGLRPLMFTTPPLESIDIDEPEDWFLAEALAKAISE